jgi:hypothetical protein
MLPLVTSTGLSLVTFIEEAASLIEHLLLHRHLCVWIRYCDYIDRLLGVHVVIALVVETH